MRAWPFGALKMFGYDVIVIDPPWPFSLHSIKGEGKSAARHYDTMPLTEIQALPVGQLARSDTLLLCWATAPLLDKCIDTVKGWGFTYKTNLAWRKLTKNGKPSVGPGYCARTMHESVILATIGRPDFKPLPSLFDGERREHSRKPDEFYKMVDRRCPRNSYKADVFSRYEREGWDCWGDQSGLFNDKDYVHRVRPAEARNAGVLSEASELPLWPGASLPGVPSGMVGALPRKASGKNQNGKARLLRAKSTNLGSQVAGSQRGGKGPQSGVGARRDDGIQRPRSRKASRHRAGPEI